MVCYWVRKVPVSAVDNGIYSRTTSLCFLLDGSSFQISWKAIKAVLIWISIWVDEWDRPSNRDWWQPFLWMNVFHACLRSRCNLTLLLGVLQLPFLTTLEIGDSLCGGRPSVRWVTWTDLMAIFCQIEVAKKTKTRVGLGFNVHDVAYKERLCGV